jgi:hypothetical protein
MSYPRKMRPSKINGQTNLKIRGKIKKISMAFIFLESWRKNIQMPGRNGP